MKQALCRQLEKSVSAVLAAAMSLSVFTAIPTAAENGGASAVGKTTYNYEGYSVDYSVTNEWDGAQTVELTVSNTGTDSILNWALKYDAQGEVSNLWNAGVYEQNDSEYVIKNTGWNFEIAPNQSVTYGYTLSGSDLSLPDSFEIYSKRAEKTEGYDVSYNITKSWDTGAEGSIVIYNTSNAAIEAWTLSFDSNFIIDNLWNGRVLENNGTSYTVAAEMWTNPIQPNSAMTIGFVGSKAVDVEAALSNFRLTEVIIGEGTPVVPIDPPVEDEKIEITANAAYDEENGNINVSWDSNKQEGTFDILMSDDGVNFTSVGTVTGASEYVYTPENGFETLYFKVVQTLDEVSADSNVVTVVNNKPTEEIVISANGVYDEKSGDITVSWETNTDGGSFEIFMSEDVGNFSSVGTVTGASEYVYTPENDFETLYFKVVQTVGEVSAESNVVIITKDTEAIVITAKAYIDEESDGVKIEWTTAKPNGTFEIFMSEDGENFTSVGVAENACEFVYSPENPFLTLYFKVKQTVGNKSAESNVERVIDWYNDLDSDEDGISDLDEIYTYFTDPENPDTDGDGLPDGYEIFTLDTDPHSADTDGNGISDGDEDIDGDGLTNLTEYGLGTDPRNNDSDKDSLTDGDEVHIYGTDPLKFDTDGDNVSDGDEIALGLDPNNAATNGVPDNERTFAQTIPADDWLFYNINTENNPFDFSVEITAAGVAVNNIEASFSGYSYSMRNEAILGSIPEFSYNENLKIEDIKINFDLDSRVVNGYNKYEGISEELSGIKRFNVFKFFEDTNMLLPIETFHDEAAGRVYAHTTETGTYCLIDMAAWLDSLGFEEYAAKAERSVMTYSAKKAASTDIDIIFILHSTREFSENIRNELTTVISNAYSYGNSVHMYFISTLGDMYMINGKEYAETAEECQNILKRFNGSVMPGNFGAPFKTANDLVFRTDSQRHMFMFDGYSLQETNPSNGFLNNILGKGVNFGILCGVVEPNLTNYKALASGNVYEVNGDKPDFSGFILNQITFADIAKDEEYMITSNGLVPMPEDFGEISINSEQDYDEDKILDIDEINFDVKGKDGKTLIAVKSDGSVVLPEFTECIDREDICVIKSLDRFYTGTEHLVPEFLDKVKIVPLRSDPTSKDSDGDGIEDIIELRTALKDDGRIDAAVKTPTSPLYANTILNILKCDGIEFDTDMKNIIAEEETDETSVKPQYSLAKEHEKHMYGKEEGIEFAYGYLGQDTDVFYLEAFAYRNSDDEIVNEIRINANVYCEEETITLTDGKDVTKDDVFNAIREKWGNKGKEYDCLENWAYDFWGLKFKVSVALNEVSDGSAAGQHIRKVNYKSDRDYAAKENHYSGKYFELKISGGTSDGRGNYTRNGLSEKPEIHLFGIVQKSGKTPVNKTKEQFCSSAAHEFGHVLGLMDAYGDGSEENFSMEPISHAEIVYNSEGTVGEEASGEMMHRSGVVSANDIEMAIFARMTGEYQFFVPIHRLSKGSTTKYGVSPAIRAEYEYMTGQTIEPDDPTVFSVDMETIPKGKRFSYNPKTRKYDEIL